MRARANFLEQLYIYHKQHKHSRLITPVIGSRKVDLWQLRNEVDSRGGYEKVGA